MMKVRLKSKPIKSVLNGKDINLTGDNTTITSNNFNVDKDGNMSCNNATMHDISVNNAIMNNSKIQGGNLKMWGNSALDGIRVFSDNSQNRTYMAYMVSDSIGINKGSHSSAMLPDSISVGSSTMYEDHITTPYVTQTSLQENKKNFEKLQDNALNIIKTIDIYKYNLKNEKDTDKKHIGFVIGDNFNYSKEVTSLDNQGVDNYSFTSLCCKAIQELSTKVEELQKEIRKIKDKEEK